MEKKNSNKKPLTIKKLYDLIWSKPMTQLVKEIECSYSDLNKICKTHNIPTPKNGHWMKLKHGKESPKIPLPSGNNDKIILDQNYSKVVGTDFKSDYHSIRRDIANDSTVNLVVPQKLGNPDPIIKNSKKIVTGKLNARQEYYKKMDSKNEEYFIPQVSKELLPRAFRILDTIFKALRKRGHTLNFKEKSIVIIGEMEIGIRLREKNKRVPDRTIGQYTFTKLVPTGIFIFQITRSLHSKEWSGTIKTPLEDKVLTILTGLELFAKNEKIYQAELEKGWEEQRIRREKEEKIKAERDAELTKLNLLLDKSEKWHRAQKFRSFLDHLENLNTEEYSEERNELIKWAREKADLMDPTIEKENDLFKNLDLKKN